MIFAIEQPDPKFDVLKTSVHVKPMEKTLEQLTVDLLQDTSFVNMRLMWDTISTSIPLE